MALTSLSEAQDWRLINPAHDVRGMTVRGPGGSSHGKVTELLLDTRLEEVYGIRLDTGRTFAARQIRVGDGEVITEGTRSEHGERDISKEFGQPIRIMKRSDDDGDLSSDSFDDRFEAHYRRTFNGEAPPFSSVRPAYWFAHRAAQEEHFQGRTYGESRRSLQSYFRESDVALPFEEVEPAIQFAFRHARNLTL